MFKERVPCKSSRDFEKFCAPKALLTSKDENVVFGHLTLKTLAVLSEQECLGLNLWGGGEEAICSGRGPHSTS